MQQCHPEQCEGSDGQVERSCRFRIGGIDRDGQQILRHNLGIVHGKRSLQATYYIGILQVSTFLYELHPDNRKAQRPIINNEWIFMRF